MVINIKDDLHNKLKKYAVNTNQQLKDVTNQAIKEFLDKNEKNRKEINLYCIIRLRVITYTQHN